MKVLDKMNELVGTEATKEEVIDWAYRNSIFVICIYVDEPQFETLESTVRSFLASGEYSGYEHENWERFLEFEFEDASQ